MPTSTSTGRAVKGILDDPSFRRKKGTNPKENFCKVVDKQLNDVGKLLITKINKKDWDSVYKEFTRMRRLIEMKEESCS